MISRADPKTSTLFARVLLNAGVSFQELSHATGIAEETIMGPATLDYAAAMTLWEATARLSGDPLVGLHAGNAFEAHQIPLLGALFAHSAGLGDALTRMAQLLPRFVEGVETRFDADDGAFLYGSPGRSRHGVDALFAAIVRLSSACARMPLRPISVDLQAPRLAPAEYRDVYGVTPRFDRPVSAIRFGPASVMAAFQGASSLVCDALEPETHHVLEADPLDDLRGALRRAIRLEAAASTLSSVAARLGMGPRTLQRRLAAEKLGFREARDDVLREFALELLGEQAQSVNAVAAQLGFSSPPAFARAFRRWTGTNPSRHLGARFARSSDDNGPPKHDTEQPALREWAQ